MYPALFALAIFLDLTVGVAGSILRNAGKLGVAVADYNKDILNDLSDNPRNLVITTLVAAPLAEEALFRWLPLLLDAPLWAYVLAQIVFYAGHMTWRYGAYVSVKHATETLVLASAALWTWWLSLPVHVTYNAIGVAACLHGRRRGEENLNSGSGEVDAGAIAYTVMRGAYGAEAVLTEDEYGCRAECVEYAPEPEIPGWLADYVALRKGYANTEQRREGAKRVERTEMPVLVEKDEERKVAVLVAETRYIPFPREALRCPGGAEATLPTGCVPGSGYVEVVVKLMDPEEFAEKEGVVADEVERIFVAPVSEGSLAVRLGDVVRSFTRDATTPA